MERDRDTSRAHCTLPTSKVEEGESLKEKQRAFQGGQASCRDPGQSAEGKPAHSNAHLQL